MKATTAFIHEPDPDHPGWHRWAMADKERFNPQVMGPLLVRSEGEASSRLRMMPVKMHSNAVDTVHGAALLALIDIALFATAYTVCTADAASAVTLDVDCRFVGAGQIGTPLDAVTEVLRETGRLIFMRGIIEQDGAPVAAYSATIRKPTRK